MKTPTLTAAAIAVAMTLLSPSPAAAADPVYTGCLTPAGKIVRLKLGDTPKRGKCHRKTTLIRLEEVARGGVMVPWDVKLNPGEAFSTPGDEVEMECYEDPDVHTITLSILIDGESMGDMHANSYGRSYEFTYDGSNMKGEGTAFTLSADDEGKPCGSEGYVVVFDPD